MGYMSDDGGETYNLCHCKLSLFSAFAIPNIYGK